MIREFFICVVAVIFTAILFRAPMRGILLSSLLGGVGYILFKILSSDSKSPIIAYFTATFFITVFSEIFARLLKMPATIFTVPAIIPLVPGIGLYRTMLNLVQNNGRASESGSITILAIVSIAMAMVMTSLLTKIINTLVNTSYKKL
ncbi:threonine/serine exporter family protein [Alkalibaculum sporogenes]|uniref:threonine/serine exporter family protein n=1 Tax=Alkalibaculum sporogenes TaxID=2655001 RepID=UPI00187B2DE6|nr:threonine/serine exporter family protein [Alkalibaculum sporogenes]